MRWGSTSSYFLSTITELEATSLFYSLFSDRSLHLECLEMFLFTSDKAGKLRMFYLSLNFFYNQ